MKGYGIHTILVDDFTQITAMLSYIRDKYTLNKVFISGALIQRVRIVIEAILIENHVILNSRMENGLLCNLRREL